MTSSAKQLLSLSDATLSWQQLSASVDGLLAAWQAGEAAPTLADFLPAEPAALRRIVLIELIKVDLEQRLRCGAASRDVEHYVDEFPELAGQPLPCDLIYEEFQLRKAAGQAVEPPAYYRRFPEQAEQLARLFAADVAPRTTSLARGGSRRPNPPLGEPLDDFDLLARLGEGAFASVFLARQRSLQRLVALKISGDRGPEPQTLAQLDHPHIVRVYDHRELAERNWRLLYMQYVAGGTLQDVIEYQARLQPSERSGASYLAAVDRALRRRGESPPAESSVRHKFQRAAWPEVVCWLGARLASALAYAHDHGILHRDVKPANVLIGEDGSPKLADFNISFSSKLDGATPAAYFGGSLAYMSPEQLEACDPHHERRPDDLDGRSDVYSLGILMWELLAGSRPFTDELVSGNWSQTLAGMAAQRRRGIDSAALARLPLNCPASLRKILLTCLAGDREKRWASAAELARQLELCLQPRAQNLLELPGTDWRSLPRRFPVTSLVLAGLTPNLVMSGLNIAYNWAEIIRHLNAADQRVFIFLLTVVNGIAYAWGFCWALYLCWPVVVAMWEVTGRGRDRWQPPTPRWLPSLRARALRLGEYAFWVSAVDWAFSGFVFPTWIQAQAGDSSALKTVDYVHFIVSQTLCGLESATLTFFLVTLVAVRACYPRLIGAAPSPPLPQPAVPGAAGRSAPAARVVDDAPTIVQHPALSSAAERRARRSAPTTPEADVVLAVDFTARDRSAAEWQRGATAGSTAMSEETVAGASAGERRAGAVESTAAQDAASLLKLGRRVWIYFGLAVAVPFLAVTVLVGLDIERGAIGALGIVGLFGFALSFWLALVIRNDVAALARAAQPSGMTLADGDDTSESFWANSRS